MKISFVRLQREHAEEIVSWRYDSPYEIYDYRTQSPHDAIEYLIEPTNQFFAVLDDAELIAFRSFGPEGRVAGGNYDDLYLDTGGGLRPDLTGQGIGTEIVRKGIEFGAQEFGTERFRVTIAAFNQRALNVCRRIGFDEDHRFRRISDQGEFVVMKLKRKRREQAHGEQRPTRYEFE